MTNETPLRIIFAGTPEFAARHLQVMLEHNCEVIAVYTQPDRPAGRGKKLHASAVKRIALEHEIPVHQPENLKTPQAQAVLADYQADLMVVVAYGLLLPQDVLDTPRLGCINVHGSILPRWRGAAPIQRAIEAGDRSTGVTIMQMDSGLDTGPMLLKSTCHIDQYETSASLHDKLLAIGPPALLETLKHIQQGNLAPTAQNDEEACYASKIEKAEAQLDWTLPADVLDLKIRAFNPFPIAFSYLGKERIRILAAQPLSYQHHALPGTRLDSDQAKSVVIACGDHSALELKVIQLPGKKAMAVSDVLNGSGQLLQVGIVLGA